MSSNTTTHPDLISGGCLCGAIQYSLEFSHDDSWPPKSATCQCTMCRKWTASLVPQFLIIRPSQITPPLSSFQTYKEFSSSKDRYRGFCGQCGSPLIWRSDEKTETMDLFLGTIDEKWLLGERVTGSEKESEFGKTFQRTGGIGKEIATPNQFQFYYENVIKGVTDLLDGGKKYLTENKDGKSIN